MKTYYETRKNYYGCRLAALVFIVVIAYICIQNWQVSTLWQMVIYSIIGLLFMCSLSLTRKKKYALDESYFYIYDDRYTDRLVGKVERDNVMNFSMTLEDVSGGGEAGIAHFARVQVTDITQIDKEVKAYSDEYRGIIVEPDADTENTLYLGVESLSQRDLEEIREDLASSFS